MAISVKLDETLRARVESLAKARRRTPNWVVREAIREYVEREEAHESFTQEALAALTHYRETGRHVTGPEVRDWLNTWGTETEADPPECHE